MAAAPSFMRVSIPSSSGRRLQLEVAAITVLYKDLCFNPLFIGEAAATP